VESVVEKILLEPLLKSLSDRSSRNKELGSEKSGNEIWRI
jgi:hypothetical protein